MPVLSLFWIIFLIITIIVRLFVLKFAITVVHSKINMKKILYVWIIDTGVQLVIVVILAVLLGGIIG